MVYCTYDFGGNHVVAGFTIELRMISGRYDTTFIPNWPATRIITISHETSRRLSPYIATFSPFFSLREIAPLSFFFIDFPLCLIHTGPIHFRRPLSPFSPEPTSSSSKSTTFALCDFKETHIDAIGVVYYIVRFLHIFLILQDPPSFPQSNKRSCRLKEASPCQNQPQISVSRRTRHCTR